MHRTQIKSTHPNCHARYSCWHSMSTKILSVVEIWEVKSCLKLGEDTKNRSMLSHVRGRPQGFNWLLPVLSSFARLGVGLGSVGPLLAATPNSTVASRIGVWWWCDGHVREGYDSDKRPPQMLAQFVFVEKHDCQTKQNSSLYS